MSICRKLEAVKKQSIRYGFWVRAIAKENSLIFLNGPMPALHLPIFVISTRHNSNIM